MANAGAIDTVLFPGFKAIVGDDLVNAGSYVVKPGYHNSRNNLLKSNPGDYSIQLAIDKEGPGDLGSAQDSTFKSAQAGNFANIAKYSKRLYLAGVAHDPRTYPMREFQGNIDSDRQVEGWSYYRGHELTSSDLSHLWHIHISVHRKYINDEAAMRSILSILAGETNVPVYPKPTNNKVYLSKLVLGQQNSDSVYHLQAAANVLGAKLALTGDLGKSTFEAWARELFDSAEYDVEIINDL